MCSYVIGNIAVFTRHQVFCMFCSVRIKINLDFSLNINQIHQPGSLTQNFFPVYRLRRTRGEQCASPISYRGHNFPIKKMSSAQSLGSFEEMVFFLFFFCDLWHPRWADALLMLPVSVLFATLNTRWPRKNKQAWMLQNWREINTRPSASSERRTPLQEYHCLQLCTGDK